MKMNGLNLLKANLYKTKIDKLEAIIGYEIEDNLKFLFSFFELGQEGFLNAYRSFDGIKIPITFVEYENSEFKLALRLSYFYSIKEIELRWQEDVKYSEEYKLYNLLPIVYFDITLDHLFVNPKEGGVYYCWNNQMILFAPNIIQFCMGLVETEILDEDFKGNEVYRKWGEDFWRVRQASDKPL